MDYCMCNYGINHRRTFFFIFAGLLNIPRTFFEITLDIFGKKFDFFLSYDILPPLWKKNVYLHQP